MDIIVVTAPSESVAIEYARELEALKQQNFSSSSSSSSSSPSPASVLAAIDFYCVSDPSGKRVGSGGGTLNAIDTLLSVYPVEVLLTKRVTIVHSGGDSRRSPTHSVCGKAWAAVTSDLNPLVLLIKEMINCNNASSSDAPSMPCLMIASGDVLLDIYRGQIPLVDNSVCVIGVPEKVTTSCNHGVIIPSSMNAENGGGGGRNLSSRYITSTMDYYLQKPKMAEIFEKNGAFPFDFGSEPSSPLPPSSLPSSANSSTSPKHRPFTAEYIEIEKNQRFSIIDTGIVIYTGSAYAAILESAMDPVLSTCTSQRGLSFCSNGSASVSVSSEPTLRLELYSEMLLASSTQIQKRTFFGYLDSLNVKFEDHVKGITVSDVCIDEIKCGSNVNSAVESFVILLSSHGSNYIRSLFTLYSKFSPFVITTIIAIDGHFAHLGTSEEVLSLCCQIHDRAVGSHLLSPSQQASATNSITTARVALKSEAEKIEVFAKKYAFDDGKKVEKDSRNPVSKLLGRAGAIDETVTNINSIVNLSRTCSSIDAIIKENKVVEHSIVAGSALIGHQCIVSHVFPHILRDFSGGANSDLVIPDNLMLQHIFLVDNHSSSSSVAGDIFTPSICRYTGTMVALGMKDDIKKSCVLVNTTSEANFAAFRVNVSSTFLNKPFSQFLEFTGATLEDIWPQLKGAGAIDSFPSSSLPVDLTLWTAKLFPYLENSLCLNDDGGISGSGRIGGNVNNRGLWSWMLNYAGSDSELLHGDSAKSWLLSNRLSLSEIILKSDLRAMFGFRNFITMLNSPSNIYFRDLIARAERCPKPLLPRPSVVIAPSSSPPSGSLSPSSSSNSSIISEDIFGCMSASDRINSCLDLASNIVIYVSNTVRLVCGIIANCIDVDGKMKKSERSSHDEGNVRDLGKGCGYGSATPLLLWDTRDVAASTVMLLWYLEMLVGNICDPDLESTIVGILESNLPLKFSQNEANIDIDGNLAPIRRLLLTFRSLYSTINSKFLEELKLVSLELLISMVTTRSRRACLKAVLLSILQAISIVPAKRHPKLLLLCGLINNCLCNYTQTTGSRKTEDAISLLKVDIDRDLSEVNNLAIKRESNLHNHVDILSSMGALISTKIIPFIQGNIHTIISAEGGDVASYNDNYKALFESLAQKLVSAHIQYSLNSRTQVNATLPVESKSCGVDDIDKIIFEKCTTVICRSSVRIDIAGGWSDTPPIAYDIGGSVLNMAIKVDGQYPLMVVGRVSRRDETADSDSSNSSGSGSSSDTSCGSITFRSLKLRSDSDYYKKRDNAESSRGSSSDGSNNNSRFDGDVLVCTKASDFENLLPHTSNALLRSAAVITGLDRLVLSSRGMDKDVKRRAVDVEIASLSFLPQGSGTGASSCLAAAAVRAMEKLVGVIRGGRDDDYETYNDYGSNSSCGSGRSISLDLLVDKVSAVEQLMTTGGGWQDQVGSIFGGFKIGRSPGVLPMVVQVAPLSLPEAFIKSFERRAFLVFTGQSRLAKNTLINALYRYAMTPSMSAGDHGCDSIVHDLVAGANFGYECLNSFTQSSSSSVSSSIEADGDERADALVDIIADVISNYWSLKSRMAHGSETPLLTSLLHRYLPEVAQGAGMLGAGAGGFAVVITKRRASRSSSQNEAGEGEGGFYSKADLERVVQRFEADCRGNISGPQVSEPLSVHNLSVDAQGLAVEVLTDDSKRSMLAYFDTFY